MVEAAMLRVIDFRDADPLDRRWWARLRLALDHVERANVARLRRLYYDYDLAILSRGGLTEKSDRDFVKAAEAKLFAMANAMRPWDAKDSEQGRKDEVAALGEAWAREFGDYSDPATQQAIEETVRMLTKMDVGARMPKNAPTVLG